MIELVETYGEKRWKKISQCIGGGKTGAQCGTVALKVSPCLISSQLNTGNEYFALKFERELGNNSNCVFYLA